MPPVTNTPLTSMLSAARADGSVSRVELERVIAFANRGGLKDDEKKLLLSQATKLHEQGKLSDKLYDFTTRWLGGDTVASKGTAVGKQLDKMMADGKVSAAEAKQLVSMVKQFGVSQAERERVSKALGDQKYADAFEPGAAEQLAKIGVKVPEEGGEPKPKPAEGYVATRQAFAVAFADGKLSTEELQRLGGLVRKDGVSDAEQQALADAYAQNTRRLDAAATAWFKKFTP